MPLERVVVRNEYGLGMPELFKGAREAEDPKAVFDGVAVAGLLGLLRQLGDLAEFAAEVFHGLQEEVMTTSLRSRKLLLHAKQIESALPTLEKVALAQKSHLHFCYTAGIDWHVHIQNQHNHLTHGYLPKFIMDSYEECREPPRLHMLDKFDLNGPGSCLKNYSDPTFFKKASPIPDEAANRAEKERKHLRSKKKRKGPKNREVQNLSISDRIARMQFVSTDLDSPACCISNNKTSSESGLEGVSQSFELKAGLDYLDCVVDHKPSVKALEEEVKEPQSPQFTLQPYDNFNLDFSYNNGEVEDNEYHFKSSLQYEPSSSSARVSWDEKTEIVNCNDYECLPEETPETIINDPPDDAPVTTATNLCDSEHVYVTSDSMSAEPFKGLPEDVGSDSEDFMDALNTIESEAESYYQAKLEEGHGSSDVNIPEAAYQSSHELETLSSMDDGTSHSRTSSECIDPATLADCMHGELLKDAVKNNINASMDALNCSHSELTNSDPEPTSVLVSQDFEKLPSETLVNGSHDAHESSSGSSEKCSVTFWTNGGLLGLQPSKPPVLKESVVGKNNLKEVESPINSAANGPNATFCSDELTGASKCSAADKTTDVSYQELDNTPPMSGLAFRLFSNGFQRKLLSIHDYKSSPVSCPENDSEKRTATYKSFHGRSPKKFFSTGFDVNSPSSSPPLEQMKISFLPASAAEASHLKLKFHREEVNHELYGDMMPSFQLVPDSSIHPLATGADSDDDTFCRSPDSRSDDNIDYRSESSSGRWESSETSESNDQEFYDDMSRTTSAGESSSYKDDHNNKLPKHFQFQPGRGSSHFIENVDKEFDSPANALPNFDFIKSSVQTTESGSDLNESLTALHLLNEATPPPPPIPPSQWMSAKLWLSSTSDQQDVPSEDLCFPHPVTGFASLEQQNLLSTWQPTKSARCSIELPSTNKFHDQQKAFGKVEVNETAADYDDKDDLLRQIRTQVVASDDGEDDDTWSE